MILRDSFGESTRSAAPWTPWARSDEPRETRSELISSVKETCRELRADSWHGLAGIMEWSMRILYCNKYSYRFSGTEAYLFDLMGMMRERGHEAALFSMTDERA